MNPYSPPMGYAAPYGDSSVGAKGAPTEMTLELLRQTRPWVLFLGVMAFIGAAFLLLGGVASLVLGAVAGSSGGAPMMLLGLLYIPLALLYVYPGLKLWHYGQAIGRLMSSRGADELETALSHQKSFWKFAGIASIVCMVLYAVVIAGAVVAGIVGATNHFR